MGCFNQKIITRNEDETKRVAREFASRLKPGGVVALYGGIGAGKTTFFKGVAEYFGIGEITSPTFTLLCEYDANPPLYHFDAYRINAAEWESLGFDDYLYGDGICFIEWAENVRMILSRTLFHVEQLHQIELRRGGSDDERIITING